MSEYDVIIIGAGIAGVGLAAALASKRSVLVLEMEAQPGYHSTGRSNAYYHESYGGPVVQPLSSASRAFLTSNGFLTPRPSITIGKTDDRKRLEQFYRHFSKAGLKMAWLEDSELSIYIPDIRPEWCLGVLEPDGADIDVAALHQHWLKAIKTAGGAVHCNAEVTAITRRSGKWNIATASQTFVAPIIVNASGAWGDVVAAMAGVAPISLTPYRRTIAQIGVNLPADPNAAMVLDCNGEFYFRPEGGSSLWLSPHDETISQPCDAAPEELDIAIAIDRFERVNKATVTRVVHKWAGLRTFAPDRAPVYGFAHDAEGFFWCVGQGGFGIQTAPAASQMAAAILLGEELTEPLSDINLEAYSPLRFI